MKTILTLASIAALQAIASAQSFVLNGGFESLPLSTSPSGSVDIGGSWVSGGIQLPVRLRGTFDGLTAIEGEHYVRFNGLGAPVGSTLEQSFITNIGQSYSVSYVIGASGTDGITVGIHGEVVSAADVVLGQADATTATLGWSAPTTFNFLATTGSTKIRFTDISPSTTGVDLNLDAVSVTAVPEPSTYAVLSGLALVGFACWRRRH